MSKLTSYKELLQDILKRGYVDLVARGDRLRTPTQVLISILEAHDYLPREVIAADLFGRAALWTTKDYANICSYLEVYEIDPVQAGYARRVLPSAVVIVGDSIKAVQNRKLRKNKYNFIASDNPLASPYGGNYYEHFDIFPKVGDYIDEGILKLSFCQDIEKSKNPLSREHLGKREEFYGKANPSLDEAVASYQKRLPRSQIFDYVFVPSNPLWGSLALVLRPW